MTDVTPTSHQPQEDRFLDWVDALVDLAEETPGPDADLAELAGTAAFAQRVAGPGSVPSLPNDRTESMWEEIMHTTPAPATTLTPPLPAGRSAREIATRSLPSPPIRGWRNWLPTALLIAAIVVAGVAAAWRIAGPFELAPGGNGPETAHQPGIAASATPAASADGCPLISDMPFFPAGAPEGVSGLGTTYAVVEEGNLTVRCPGVDDPDPLVTGVTNATPLQWPGTVLLEIDSGDAIAYDITSGERSELGPAAFWGGSWTSPGSPWLLTPNNDAYTDWRITNLKTMTSMTLSDEIGGVLPSDFFPEVAWSPNSRFAVITQKPEFGQGNPTGTPDATGAELPTSGFVVDATLATRRWIDVQGQVVVGDGVIAYETESDGQPVLRVEDAETGEAVFDIGPAEASGTSGQRFALADDGRSLVYIHNWRLWFADYRGLSDSNPPIDVVDADGRQPMAIHPTGVPGRVLVEWNSEENIGEPSEPGAKSVSILEIGPGELTDVAGLVPIDPEVPTRFSSARYLVSVGPASGSGDQVVAQMVDIATGEVVATSEPIDASVRELIEANYVFGSSLTGAVATISPPDGTPVLLSAATGTVTPVSLDSLPTTSDNGDLVWRITPSSDGALLFAIGRPQSGRTSGLDITSPNALPGRFAVATASSELDWSAPVDVLPAGVILGIPAGDTDDEPAVLEAQEFATPAPVATASPAAGRGCDLTGDIPVMNGPEPELPGTALRLVDGTLTLECDQASRVVAEGVAEVVPGSTWPGAVLLHLEDGSLRGVNIITGAEGELGSFHERVTGAFVRATRWIVFPTTPEQIDWRIVDLETMESLLLSEELGGVLPRSTVAHLWATTSNAAVIGFGGIPIIPGQVSSGPEGLGGATPPPGTPTAELPAEWSALVFDGSLTNRRWIETFRPMMTSAWISPDDEVLAHSVPADDGPTIRVERLSDGSIVADVNLELIGNDAIHVLNDGLLHLAPDRLDRITWDGTGEVEIEPMVTFDVPLDMPVLVQTIDPGIVIAGGPDPTGESVGYLIDTASGETISMPGMLLMPFVHAQYADGLPIGYVLVVMPNPDPSESTLQMYDVTTGQPVLISDPVDIAAQELAMAPAAVRGDIGFVFLPDGRTVILEAERGEASVVEAPADGGGWSYYVSPSPSGDALIMARSADDAYIRQTVPGAEWTKVTAGDFTTFIPGSDVLP